MDIVHDNQSPPQQRNTPTQTQTDLGTHSYSYRTLQELTRIDQGKQRPIYRICKGRLACTNHLSIELVWLRLPSVIQLV